MNKILIYCLSRSGGTHLSGMLTSIVGMKILDEPFVTVCTGVQESFEEWLKKTYYPDKKIFGMRTLMGQYCRSENFEEELPLIKGHDFIIFLIRRNLFDGAISDIVVQSRNKNDNHIMPSQLRNLKFKINSHESRLVTADGLSYKNYLRLRVGEISLDKLIDEIERRKFYYKLMHNLILQFHQNLNFPNERKYKIVYYEEITGFLDEVKLNSYQGYSKIISNWDELYNYYTVNKKDCIIDKFPYSDKFTQ